MASKKVNTYVDWRYFNISNFRNLGVYADTDKDSEDRTFLKLNRGLSRQEIGGLVLLLGLNNSGKSNVLAALEKWHSGAIGEDDIPDFLVQKKQPVLRMNVANGKYSISDNKGVYDYSILEYLKSSTIRGKIVSTSRSDDLYFAGQLLTPPVVVNTVDALIKLIKGYVDGINNTNSNNRNKAQPVVANDITRNIANSINILLFLLHI